MNHRTFLSPSLLAALVSSFAGLVATCGFAQTPSPATGTLLQFDFNAANPWPQVTAAGAGATVEARNVGTIDVAGSKDPSGGILLTSRAAANTDGAAALSSGPLAVRNTETHLGKLTLSFSLSVSVAQSVTVRIESFDAQMRRSGSLETLIYPAAPDFYQRYALDLSTLKPVGGGGFNPAAPFVGFTFIISGPAEKSRELRLDNVHYAKPAFYVSPQGNDANDGRTEQTALAKPQKALERAQPGDIILVANGTYLPNGQQEGIARFVRPGTPANWIVLKNYPGHRPVFSAVGTWGAIRIGNSGGGRRKPPTDSPPLAYLEIRGIHMRGDADLRTETHKPLIGKSNVRNNCNGISIEGGNQAVKTHHIRIADNIVEFCSGAGISYIKSDWALIEGNISRNNCWWMDYAGSGISIMGYSNFDATEGNYKTLIRNNVSSGNRCFVKWNKIDKISDGNGIIIDVHTGHLGRKLIQNNLVFGNGGSGIHAYSSEHVDIINNTAYLNSASPELEWNQIFAGSRVKDIRIINNIMWAPPDKPMDFKLSRDAIDVIYANNLYLGGRSTPGRTGGGLGAEAGSGKLASESENVRADPKFVNATLDYKTADFRLQSGSPALKAGRWEPFSPLADVAGKLRPRQGAADLGAFQK